MDKPKPRNNLFSFLASAAVTDLGRKRKRNEDLLARIPECGVFCVADGMGGEDSGDVASRATVDAVCDAMRRAASDQDIADSRKKAAVLVEALQQASAWIRARSVARGRGHVGLYGCRAGVRRYDA
ncbi:MAG: protein phosphatase 2C domain-containing protein [Verrucomicrobiota bacterium]|nr:protein phosphatase 2C domain-containing protein [Verrucomicrobiota bacterium]